MLKTELKLPFIWYNDKSKQYRFRPQNVDGDPFSLICGTAALLPFQIKRDKPVNPDIVSEWAIYNLKDAFIVDLTTQAGSLEIKSTETDEYITYKGTVLTMGLAEGCYYARIVKGANVYYSEVFRVYANITAFMKLEWWNDCDIAPVVYQTGFKNLLYLDTYTEAIPPDINEEGEENGTGEFLPTLQRIVHKHKIELFATDYLLDALAFMSIHGNIQLTERTDTVFIERVKVSPEYPENYGGNCRIEFELPGAYVRTNCCGNLNLIS